MYNDKLLLTIEEIFDKDFKIDARGYRPQEVDKFLDMVMHDYKEYNGMIKECSKEIKLLNEELLKYKQEIRRLKTLLESAEETGTGNVNNVDLLRRLSKLEKVVFGDNK